MDIDVVLAELDAEIDRLHKAKALLTGTTIKTKGRKPVKATSFGFGKNTAPKKRTMSPEGRARIAAAQKARWAKTKKG